MLLFENELEILVSSYSEKIESGFLVLVFLGLLLFFVGNERFYIFNYEYGYFSEYVNLLVYD